MDKNRCHDCKPGYDCYNWRTEPCYKGHFRIHVELSNDLLSTESSPKSKETTKKVIKSKRKSNDWFTMMVSVLILYIILELFKQLP